MFAIFEVLNVIPSGIHSTKWKDYTVHDGKICEKRMLGTRRTQSEAETETANRKLGSRNYIYWVNLDN